MASLAPRACAGAGAPTRGLSRLTDDASAICETLGAAIRRNGVFPTARAAKLRRETLHRSFFPTNGLNPHPSFRTVCLVAATLGFRLRIERLMRPSPEHRYRKRPVEIEAFQMNATNRDTPHLWPDWLVEAWQKPCEAEGAFFELAGAMLITTLEGQMAVSPNDWIIRGIEGELYPCKARIFAETYEAVE